MSDSLKKKQKKTLGKLMVYWLEHKPNDKRLPGKIDKLKAAAWDMYGSIDSMEPFNQIKHEKINAMSDSDIRFACITQSVAAKTNIKHLHKLRNDPLRIQAGGLLFEDDHEITWNKFFELLNALVETTTQKILVVFGSWTGKLKPHHNDYHCRNMIWNIDIKELVSAAHVIDSNDVDAGGLKS